MVHSSKGKSKTKRRKVHGKKKVKKLSVEEQLRKESGKMFYEHFTYPSLVRQARQGNKAAGVVVGMKIRAGFLQPEDMEYLNSTIPMSRNDELTPAREAFSLVN